MCRIQFPIIWYATQCDGVHTKVKFKVTKRSNTTFLPSESNGRNLLKLGGMIGQDPRNNQLVFGSDGVKGQGLGLRKYGTESTEIWWDDWS